MSLDVQVVAYRLAARGEAMEDQAPGFAQGERIAFDGVGMIAGLDPQLLFDAGDHLRRQRPQFVELPLEPIDLIQNAGCHDLFNYTSSRAATTPQCVKAASRHRIAVRTEVIDLDRSNRSKCCACGACHP